ncbi:TolC family protein [Sphingomicrobium sp. XHP0239]|uniref:TolC family protein n=1 Tax=Sphingomicrobium maritimum TaxID=3133972 RepID=UPI0031CC745F
MTRYRILMCAGMTVALAGCTTATLPPSDPTTRVPIPADFIADARPDAGTGERWWRGFEDPELNALVDTALDRNREIAAARSRLGAAAALVRAERSDLLPSLDASVGADVAIDQGPGIGEDVGASLGGALPIDLNGRLSAEIAAALADLDAATYFVADQRRVIAAAVATQYLERRRTGARLALLETSTELQEQTLEIVTLRYDAGLSSNLDVRRAAADLARTRAQLGQLQLARARASNALSVLTGDPPAPIPPSREEATIPTYEGGPSVGLPLDLLRRRPDLLIAEAELANAAAVVGVERADLLPTLTLPGSILLGDGSIGGLVTNVVAQVGALLGVPLFDGGRRRAETAAAEFELEARFADYSQRLLSVYSEVETALVAIEAFDQRTRQLRLAVEESEAAFSQSNALYREGLASLFEVLDVQRQLISSREALIDSEADLAQSHVDLYRVVGAPTCPASPGEDPGVVC